MTASGGLVVVGASAAGVAAAEGLRHGGYDGPLTLVGGEPHLPYDRPPLSKQLLSGVWERERLRLRAPETYSDLGIELRLGVRATELDMAARRVRLADGTELTYSNLVLATGARARMLPGAQGLTGVYTLRTVEDALALRTALAAHPHLLIVGGGFVGAEAAAVARGLGCEVTLVTDQQVPLADAVGAEVGTMLAEVHRERGVRIVTGSPVKEVIAEDGRAVGVLLADGRVLRAQAVLVGIGARPDTDWLTGSGLSLHHGIVCDSLLRAGDAVWAAGDVASWPDPVTGERLRIEHRTNASEQGMTVARNVLAGPSATAFQTVPYVWSDQYDLKIQIYGGTRGADAVHIVEGSLKQRAFTAVYVRDGYVTAALGVGMIRQLRALRRLLTTRTPWDQARTSLPVTA
ncbi:NADPH-dependent 2,4-dienoyl-CoA reductase/sulfur reductase-like enzyme [Streptomyces sp. SAI-135]|uniref:NAD(P)/FAD-dependent oxidoreductase n=1 Tax=unclassified Streptomyces TaxID=2593676 RepID=UPI002476EC59|nr:MULTISPECIES: FAD-dependent oxidoreductase [unclassified Streptomyces]MDH6523080.1 NADPH-dependent 2,4-dienoyl-CoA reductase/sulfur reductase-like enzyme [Streptomyces sp. SAI-090]MDH6573963.1 NADPH-dependent 2,4-dienoyl-CoA reductase/sulfur reductase-like enzyme [Streptomyces sp. SAI-117]MDH6581300.1 NADPH-dependent 2,4-dienoyl-CoA reductase/sulfur reductase-like enzyme [Streptomyces sp. SAI-133]MDH6613306.1 NADPH-dependent 2,4-dienoyl-CoA reductase/sulfur reductase-like enzyme [Streptomyce